MLLTPAQQKIASDTHRFRVINAGRRTGKTILAVEEIVAFALHKESRIAYIAPTYQQARDIAWEQLKKRTEAIATLVNESRLEIRVKTVNGGESVIVLRGWESIETLRGQKLDFIVIDEVAMMRKFWMMWKEVIRPTLTDSKGGAMFISTPKGFNHFYDLYNMEAQDDDFKSFHYTTYDNPHIDHEEIDKAKEELSEDQFAQEYLADFRKAEGLVFKEFSRKRHVYDKTKLVPPGDVICGVDFGFRNPTAVIDVVIDNTGAYWVIDEWYKTEKTHEEIGDYLTEREYRRIYPDPEDPAAIKVLEDKHLPVREVVKGSGSVVAGVNLMKELFKQGRIKISDQCVNLIAELEMYHYKEKNSRAIDDPETPEKGNDHAIDALRYVIMSNNVNPQRKAERFTNRFHTRKKLLKNYAR